MSQVPQTPIVLTDDEWARMTARRRAKEKEDIDNTVTFRPLKFLPDNIPDEDSYRAMVQAFINGKESWEAWQSNYYLSPDFGYLVFIHQIGLVDTTFVGQVNFSNAIFENPASFSNSIFMQKADFSRATFNQNAYFTLGQFIESAIFNAVTFNQQVSFSDETFEKDVDFIGATFYKPVGFNSTKFNNYANFRHAYFDNNAEFIQAVFKEKAFFNLSHFKEHANFASAFFNGCYFGGAEFGKKANFAHAQFSKEAHFAGTNFKDNCSFESASFNDIAYFIKNKFLGKEINFRTIFLSSNSRFIWENIKVEKSIPDFRYPSRDFEIRFHGVSLPCPKDLLKQSDWDKEVEDKYRKLKELAIANHSHEYELKFNGYEMESKIINYKKSKWSWEKLKEFFKIKPLQAYGHLSGFGQSIWRPIGWLIFLFLLYNIFKNFNYVSFYPEQAIFSIFADYESIKTIMPIPLFVNNFKDGDDIKAVEFGIKSLASVLWFLFFLGVRNNFKIK